MHWQRPTATSQTLENIYKDYQPPYPSPREIRSDNLMKVSLQANYYNRAFVGEDKEMHLAGLVQAGLRAESSGDYPQAIRHYQAVLEKYPDALIPIGTGGADLFLLRCTHAAARCWQFPAKQLDYYRLQYDPPAREIFERALARFNVHELHELADFHLATTSGSKALLFELGRARARCGRRRPEAANYFRRLRQYHRPGDVDSFKKLNSCWLMPVGGSDWIKKPSPFRNNYRRNVRGRPPKSRIIWQFWTSSIDMPRINQILFSRRTA